MSLLTEAETRQDRPVCSLCGLTYLTAHTIQVHRPCRTREDAANKLARFNKPNGLFTVRDNLVMLVTEVKRYEAQQARRF